MMRAGERTTQAGSSEGVMSVCCMLVFPGNNISVIFLEAGSTGPFHIPQVPASPLLNSIKPLYGSS